MRAASVVLLLAASLVAASDPLITANPQVKPAQQTTITDSPGPFKGPGLSVSGSYDPKPLQQTTTFAPSTPGFNTLSYGVDTASYYGSVDASIASASAAAASASANLATGTSSSSLIVKATGTGTGDGAIALGGSYSAAAAAGIAFLVGAAALL